MSADWYAQALCARNWDNDYDATAPDWFADRSNGKSSKAAISICRHCPVAKECLTLALKCEVKASDREGIYGGLTPDDREALWPSNPETPESRRGKHGPDKNPFKRTAPGRDAGWLARVHAGEPMRQIAISEGLSPSTVYNAIGRMRKRGVA